MKTYLKLAVGTSLSLAMIAGSAVAGQPNVNQKGSLMIFPLVDTYENRDTIVRIENDGPSTVWVECYMKNASKASSDFAFPLTREASISISMVDKGFRELGRGKLYPWEKFSNTYQGELKCFAVDSDISVQRNYNYLSGTATVVDYDAQTAFEYNSWNFKALFAAADPIVPGILNLDGKEYDQCPDYVKFTYVKPGRAEGVGSSPLTAGYSHIAVASCTQDLRQDKMQHFTKLQFSIYDADENPLSGSWDCIDTWRYVRLDEIDHNAANFAFNLKTTTAVVQVRGVGAKAPGEDGSPDDCYRWADAPEWVKPEGYSGFPQILPEWAKVKPAGLVGIVVRELDVPLEGGPGAVDQEVTNLTAAEMNSSGKNQVADVIRWNPEAGPSANK